MRQTTSVAVPPERPIQFVLIRTRPLAASWAAQLNLPTESLLLNSSSVLMLGTGHLPSLPPTSLLHASVRLCSSWLLCAIHVASQAKQPANDQPSRSEHTLSCASRAVMLASFSAYHFCRARGFPSVPSMSTRPPTSSYLLTMSKEPFLLHR